MSWMVITINEHDSIRTNYMSQSIAVHAVNVINESWLSKLYLSFPSTLPFTTLTAYVPLEAAESVSFAQSLLCSGSDWPTLGRYSSTAPSTVPLLHSAQSTGTGDL